MVRLSGERSILASKSTLIEEDEFTEILCIDELDLSHCKVKFLPNFEHTCINKVSLAHNALSNKQHLVISKFSTFFMDYLDLQWNNITDLKPIISNQKFRQDNYKIKNSPLNYYLGSPASQDNTSIHTFIDVKQNRFFNCDCDLITQFMKYASIEILNECVDEKKFQDQCFAARRSMQNLNKKIRLILGIFSALLFILTCVLSYYMCSDCAKNSQPYDRIQFSIRQFICRFNRAKAETDIMTPSGNLRSTGSSKVIYSKLDNETTSSNFNLEIQT